MASVYSNQTDIYLYYGSLNGEIFGYRCKYPKKSFFLLIRLVIVTLHRKYEKKISLRNLVFFRPKSGKNDEISIV